jgi:hypothetical protein
MGTVKNKEVRKRWSPKEVAALKEMSEMGMNSTEIGAILGRTTYSVSYQKKVRGIYQNRKEDFTGLRVLGKGEPILEVVPETPSNPLRNPSKEIAKIARHIARENGKRITMAMFFVEDL